MQEAKLLPGDTIQVAFTLDHNDHPEFGGIELNLRDFRSGTEVVGLSQKAGVS